MHSYLIYHTQVLLTIYQYIILHDYNFVEILLRIALLALLYWVAINVI